MVCRSEFAVAVLLEFVAALRLLLVQLVAVVAEFHAEADAAEFPADPAQELPAAGLAPALNYLMRAEIPAVLAEEVFGGHLQALGGDVKWLLSPNPRP